MIALKQSEAWRLARFSGGRLELGRLTLRDAQWLLSLEGHVETLLAGCSIEV